MVRPDMRAALEDLRRIIQETAPHAEECISYQMPAFKQDGMLVAFAAHTHHCSLYGWNGTAVMAMADQLQGFEISKGTIRFTPERPIPEAVVRHLVQEKIEDNARRARDRRAKKKA
ncbi:MAG: hypothetical protein CFE28_14935 [Alphaproteobacteria bacterium PA2]|nr:MAG: hypothetical protein CFE28_14935 [Alphaproteobacteria bacterium PA2]